MNRFDKRNITRKFILRKDQVRNKKYAVKFRIGYNRKYKYCPVNYEGEPLYLSETELEHFNSETRSFRGKNLEIKNEFNKVKRKAENVIDDITKVKPFTLEEFESQYFQESQKTTFFTYLDKVYDERIKNGQIGTAKSYNNAFTAFKKYRKDKPLLPHELTVQELKNFHTYLSNTVSLTTIGIYMRSLKVAFNRACDDIPELRELNPFAQRQGQSNRYQIRTGSGHKGEALSPGQIKTFIESETIEGTSEWESKMYWLFSFYCQGMNVKDIAYLRNRNIDLQNNVIQYVRRKTRNTELKESLITIPLNEDIVNIINSLGKDGLPDDFVFPIIDNSMSEERQDAVIRQKIKIINKWLVKLCEANKLPPMTSYWARHSYASLLRKSGVATEMIRELLDHSDLRTTENYLKRFEVDEKRKVNEKAAQLYKSA